MIDYLHVKMQIGGGRRKPDQRDSEISRRLKSLWKKNSMPGLVPASQFEPLPEQRRTTRPINSDLRESEPNRAGRRRDHVV